MRQIKPNESLWTYDFTVITVGSLISMVGSTLADFAISLTVLDDTGSIFLYMLFNVAAQLPQLVLPVLAGPLLDRMSRKKVIYGLDFFSAGLYAVLAFLLWRGWFNYPVFLLSNVVIGSINSVYMVAYDSFYPNLITEGNESKAYSVSSLLFDIAAMTYPLAAVLYTALGSAVPIFLLNGATFFLAACFERSIRHRETHMDAAARTAGDKPSGLRQFCRDFWEGLDYMKSEKGLLLIAAYFMVSNLCGGANWLILPFFRNHPQLFAGWPVAAATLYTIVCNFSTAGRLVGGMFQYKVRIPKERKFAIALTVYIVICFLEGGALFLPIPLMAVAFFLEGVLGVTSYTIRSAATQAYVPDSKRARFNGTFQMLTGLGAAAGSLAVGALAEFFPERAILVGTNLLSLLSAYLLIYRGREHVKKIYNRDV